ncbi:hypothetical protein [Paraburkholderia haematera]|nr:hypothetical protein [Paraburkholderia haematera]
MTATCYGHAVFFVMAQKHAGEVRAAAVPVISAPSRNLAEIASDRAGAVARLARVTERRCGGQCAAVRMERATLNAQLVALDAESAEVTRRELTLERADAARTTAKADPVAGLLTAFGVSTSRVDLIVGMAFAVVLEGIACFCWLLALRFSDRPFAVVTPEQEVSHGLPVTPVTPASNAVAPVGNDATGPEKTSSSRASEKVADVTNVLTAIHDGTLRGTVIEIRKHLGCSQAKAAAVRREIAQHTKSISSVTDAISRS